MKFRIIPRLEIKNSFLIKGMRMEGLKKIGNPILFAKKYSFDKKIQSSQSVRIGI